MVRRRTHAKSPVDAEVAKEGVIPANENLLSVGFPKISVLMFRGSSASLSFSVAVGSCSH